MAGGLTLDVWLRHSHIPLSGDMLNPIPWVRNEGYDPMDMGGVIDELYTIIDMHDVNDVLRLYNATSTSTMDQFDVRFYQLNNAGQKIAVNCVIHNVPMPSTEDVTTLVDAFTRQLERHRVVFATLKMLEGGRNFNPPEMPEQDDEERVRKVPIGKRVFQVVSTICKYEGLAKSMDGTPLAPVFVSHGGVKKYCMCYKTMEENTDGSMAGVCRRAVQMWITNHPLRRMSNIEIDLTDIETNNAAISNAAEWMQHPCHADINVPLAQINRYMLTVLVDGEPFILFLGRQSTRTDPDPALVSWPTLTRVTDFDAARFNVDQYDVTRMLLRSPVKTEWLDVFNRVAEGLHPEVVRELAHLTDEYGHDYPQYEVRWVAPSMRQLKDEAVMRGRVWHETTNSAPFAEEFVNTSDAACRFRAAEMLLVDLLAPLTPAFNKLVRDQGYTPRTSALALMSLFGVCNTPTQLKVRKGEDDEYVTNHGSQRAVYTYGVSGSGKSMLCQAVQSCYQSALVHHVSNNNQTSAYNYVSPHTHIIVAPELGDAPTFESTHDKTDWLSITTCEHTKNRRKGEHHTTYKYPDQPVCFFGSDAPFCEQQWVRRFTHLHFGTPIPPGMRSADMGTRLIAEIAQLIMVGAGWMCYNRYMYTRDEQSEPIVHYLSKQFQTFRAAYMQRGNPLAAFLLDEDKFKFSDSSDAYVRVDRLRTLYNAWIEETNQTVRGARAPPKCNENTLLPLCNDNGLVLRAMSAVERQRAGINGTARCLVVERIEEK
jgi:hypothetical protein